MRFGRLALSQTGLSLVVVLAACGGTSPPAVTPTLSSSPPQSLTSASPATAAAAAPALAPAPPPPAPVAEPTVLTDEQKKRDQALLPKIAPFVDAYANVDALLTSDHKRVVFRSNRDGQWQAYVADPKKPNDVPLRITASAERVMSARLTPDEKYVVYRADEGGDGNFRIYRANLDGSAPANLTPGEKLNRDAPLFPRLRPSEMVYAARSAKEASTSIYVQGVREGEPRKLYTDTAPLHVVDVSPDGSRALVVREKSASDEALFRVDLDDGKATRIFPSSERRAVSIQTAKFSFDGKRVFVATDDGADAHLVRIEPGSGVISGRFKDDGAATARIANIAVSPKSDRLAIVVDSGSHTEARILDETLKPIATVKSPLGVVKTGDFAADGKTFTAVLTTPDKPADVFEVDATSGAMKPLRNDARPGFASLPKSDTSIASVPSFDGLPIAVNVYLPSGKREKLPVFTWIHAGLSASAMVKWNASTQFWLSQGYAVVEPNVRGSTGFGRTFELADNKEKRENAVKDLEAVNKWLRDQPWCDRDRIAIAGSGYGGYMTLLALERQPAMWRAGIDQVGIYDLRSFFRSTDATIRSALEGELGDPDKDAASLSALSPSTQVDKITAPLFVYQGSNELRVPRGDSDVLVWVLRSRHVPVEYMLLPEEGQPLEHREKRIELLSREARFLSETMRENGNKSAAVPQPIAAKN